MTRMIITVRMEDTHRQQYVGAFDVPFDWEILLRENPSLNTFQERAQLSRRLEEGIFSMVEQAMERAAEDGKPPTPPDGFNPTVAGGLFRL